MPLQPIQFAAQSYQDRSLPVSSQRLVNLYLEKKPQDAKALVALHGTPGLRAFASVGTGPIRGMIGMGAYLYVASGAALYRVDRFGTATLAGALTGIQPVSMAQNGVQVCVVDDADIFYATDVSFGVVPLTNYLDVTVLDGYGILVQRDSQRVQITAINDFSTVSAIEFTLANAYPDNNVAVVANNREFWVLNERSIQVYYNSGQANFPFSRIPSGVIERGCLSRKSVAQFQGVVFWLGDDKRVYMSQGYSPQSISTHAIDKAISGYADPASSRGFVYSQEGHVFYALSFNEATWVYDVSTGLWHERVSDGRDNWRVQSHAFWFEKNLVGDVATADIYELDLDKSTDDGDVIRRETVSPPLFANGHRVRMNKLLVDMQGGVGLTTGQGSDPQAMLQWSDNGGHTWSSEYWRSFGKIGEYGKRAHWERLGQFRQRSLRLTIADPVKVAILGAYADLEGTEP